MVRTENGKTLKVEGKGRVEFTDDDSDVKSLEPGGRFSFETANGWFSGFTASRFEATAATRRLDRADLHHRREERQ